MTCYLLAVSFAALFVAAAALAVAEQWRELERERRMELLESRTGENDHVTSARSVQREDAYGSDVGASSALREATAIAGRAWA